MIHYIYILYVCIMYVQLIALDYTYFIYCLLYTVCNIFYSVILIILYYMYTVI